jgi:hypothetical protein
LIGHPTPTRFIIHTNFTDTVKRVYTITLDDLAQPESLKLLRGAFNQPDELRAPQTPAQVTQDAAAQFAQKSTSNGCFAFYTDGCKLMEIPHFEKRGKYVPCLQDVPQKSRFRRPNPR